MPKIVWKRSAEKQLDKLPRSDSENIRKAVKELEKWPDTAHLNIEKITDTKAHNRLRVGNYRVIWELKKGEPTVIEIQQVLRRTSRTYS